MDGGLLRVSRVACGDSGGAADWQSVHHDGVQCRLLVRIGDLPNRSEKCRHRRGFRDARHWRSCRAADHWAAGTNAIVYWMTEIFYLANGAGTNLKVGAQAGIFFAVPLHGFWLCKYD